mmetsp:Transcript_35321/g.56356  ORF Transcript_35321/g.56356 Transcript_35321/m.56356 type:complete len:237 (+) Transcript_35321:1199-1909(+)
MALWVTPFSDSPPLTKVVNRESGFGSNKFKSSKSLRNAANLQLALTSSFALDTCRSSIIFVRRLLVDFLIERRHNSGLEHTLSARLTRSIDVALLSSMSKLYRRCCNGDSVTEISCRTFLGSSDSTTSFLLRKMNGKTRRCNSCSASSALATSSSTLVFLSNSLLSWASPRSLSSSSSDSLSSGGCTAVDVGDASAVNLPLHARIGFANTDSNVSISPRYPGIRKSKTLQRSVTSF